MSDGSAKSAPLHGRFGPGDIISYGLAVVAILLGWQVAIQPFVQRGPVDLAVRLSPESPMVLRRAAESELAAGRIDNAASLSRDALVRSPFDVRALRTVGLTDARAGLDEQADELLTLAGNWSLRDDPAHAWLVERRLRRADYASSFAHADTLVRRREDIQPQIFRLFTVAGAEDPQRSLPVIAALIAAEPPWRNAYLSSLNRTPQELQIFAALAVMLESSAAPLNKDELQHLYWTLLGNRQFAALQSIRSRINRPLADLTVTNGGFADTEAPEPFQWRLFQKAGISAEVVDDDLRPANPALRVDYDGYAAGTIAEQLIFLTPGSYRFSAQARSESGNSADRIAWTLTCANVDREIASIPVQVPAISPNTWSSLTGTFEVQDACAAQWLRLETRANDRRSHTAMWFDRVVISPAD